MASLRAIVAAIAVSALAAAGPDAAAGAGPSLRSEVLYAFEAPPPVAPQASLLRHRRSGAFYGTLSGGGPGGHGAIFRYDPATATSTTVHLFDGADGSAPYGALIEGPGGALYGTTRSGGVNGRGTLFRYLVRSGALTTLHHFGTAEGSPESGVVLAPDGKLYGAAGMISSTVLYRYDLSAAAFQIAAIFSIGGWPTAAPIVGSDGQLYGVGGCGNSGGGAIYRYDPATSTPTVLRTFVNASGTFPCAPLVQAADDLLYGSTVFGGAFGKGVLFRLDPATLAYTVLHDFDGATGEMAFGGVFQAANGALYGTTTAGGTNMQGTLFRLDPAAPALTVVHHFGGKSGFAPYAALVDAGDGTLLGTTAGGQAGSGTIYRFAPATNTLATAHRFHGGAGSTPQADLLRGVDGALYGTTAEGGPGGDGTLFRYDLATGAYATLHAFDGTHGGRPVAGVITGADGALYGTASRGGTFGFGTVFRYDPQAATLGALHHFDGSFADGGQPVAAVVRASDGALYGTTSRADAFFGGTLFRYEPASSAFTTLHEFFNARVPMAALIEAADGALYGTAGGDGPPQSPPNLFRWNPATSSFSQVQRFHGLALPSAAAFEDGDALYMTAASQSSFGDIYRYGLTTGAMSIPFQFSGTDGADPLSSLIRGADGALYGTTMRGGAFDLGTVFRFDPATSVHTVIHEFRGLDGANPRAGVLLGLDGALYGTTAKGGPLGGGTLFRLVRWR